MKLLPHRVVLMAMVLSLSACASDQDVETTVPVNDSALIIDVRTQQEFDAWHVAGAIDIPYEAIGDHIGDVAEDRAQEIILYCRSGRRAGIALRKLQEMGYTNVRNAGGLAEARKLVPSGS